MPRAARSRLPLEKAAAWYHRRWSMPTLTSAVDPVETKQPRGLYLLAGVEMWERFSYYGMRAFLVLFLVNSTHGFGWSKKDAGLLYGSYTGLVYLTGLIGGYLSDRWLGPHRAIIVGSTLIAAGHFTLAIPSQVAFFVGLLLIILGTGFHKPIISTMVGQLYHQGDARRDGGFTIFYMGINVGAFIGPLICGSLAQSASFGWHWGFASAGVGMVIGTGTYLVLKRRLLGSLGDIAPAKQRVAAGSASATVVPAKLTRADKEGIAAIVILAVFNIFFWCAYEQAGSSMNFFADERTNRWLFGYEIPTAWFQSVNSAVIILCAPLFAALWTWLGRRGREPSTAIKFVWSLVLVAIGFVFLVIAARLSDGGTKVSPLWLVVAISFHTWGELCLSPVGLSMVTRLAPVRLASFMMGFWWFSFFLSDFTAGLLASTVESIEKGHIFRLLGGQADFYLIFVVVPLVGAALLLALTPLLKRLMAGRA
jgi:POT family proton-dependent oligopeptide transporter